MSQQPVGFRRATRQEVKARVALAGPSGSGKTYTALVIATALAGEGKIAVIDTEKGSASLYADQFTFDVLELGPPYSPERYVAGMHAAEKAGYAVVVVDSLSHGWSDEGGVLSIVDNEAARSKGNKFDAWRKGTPEHNRLVNALVQSPIHVVATMRTKTAYAVEQDDKGRTKVRKLGMEPVQRENIEYEFSVVGEMDLDHRMVITKSRLTHLQDRVVAKPGYAFGLELVAELRDGVSEESAPSSKPVADPVPAQVADSSGLQVPPHQASAGTPTSEGAPTPESPAAGPATSTEAAAAPSEDSSEDSSGARASVPDQAPGGEAEAHPADSVGDEGKAPQEPAPDEADDGTPATDQQWALLDQHRERVSSAKLLQAARALFPQADIRSKSEITQVQFEKAFWAAMDKAIPVEEPAETG